MKGRRKDNPRGEYLVFIEAALGNWASDAQILRLGVVKGYGMNEWRIQSPQTCDQATRGCR